MPSPNVNSRSVISHSMILLAVFKNSLIPRLSLCVEMDGGMELLRNCKLHAKYICPRKGG